MDDRLTKGTGTIIMIRTYNPCIFSWRHLFKLTFLLKSPKIMLANKKIQWFKTKLANATVFVYLPHVKFFVNFIINVWKFCFLQPTLDLTICWREHFMLGITVIFGVWTTVSSIPFEVSSTSSYSNHEASKAGKTTPSAIHFRVVFWQNCAL